jgi:hypothetical protein
MELHRAIIYTIEISKRMTKSDVRDAVHMYPVISSAELTEDRIVLNSWTFVSLRDISRETDFRNVDSERAEVTGTSILVYKGKVRSGMTTPDSRQCSLA